MSPNTSYHCGYWMIGKLLSNSKKIVLGAVTRSVFVVTCNEQRQSMYERLHIKDQVRIFFITFHQRQSVYLGFSSKNTIDVLWGNVYVKLYHPIRYQQKLCCTFDNYVWIIDINLPYTLIFRLMVPFLFIQLTF